MANPDAPAPTLQLDLAYVIADAARANGYRITPDAAQGIARAIIARPGLIAALHRAGTDG